MEPTLVSIKQHPERAIPDEITEVLAAGMVAHFGYVVNGKPVIIPMGYLYEAPATVYVHGHPRSQILNHLVAPSDVCVSLSLVDGLVYSKSALHHSMNYRSVVAYGTSFAVTDLAEKRRLLDRMMLRYFPGRAEGRDYSAATEAQLVATHVIGVTFDAWSAKARRIGANGPGDHDPAVPGNAGVIPMNPPTLG